MARRAAAAVLIVCSTAGAVPSAHHALAALPAGLSRYEAVAPSRLADTRPSEGAFGFTRVSPSTIRVTIAGRGGVPNAATAAVLNITSVDAYGSGFVTIFPTGTARPNASSLNADAPGRVIANMVTVKLGGGSVDIFMNTPMHLVVDVSGAYLPVSSEVAAGRLETIPTGARRATDTRTRGYPMAPGTMLNVDLTATGVPTSAAAVVVNVTAVDANVGFWTVYPAGQAQPRTSSLNIDGVGQTRPGQAIVQLSGGRRSINVFSQSGGHLVVDVAGWFTGSTAAISADGLFLPSNPTRLLDTRNTTVLTPWGGTTFEFSSGSPLSSIAAAAINITGVDQWQPGFVTAYPAGLPRPLSSHLNVANPGQIIANHAIVAVSNRGIALYTQNGVHLVADVAGWYLGSARAATQPPPTNPAYRPNRATSVSIPAIGQWLPIETGPSLDAIADRGHAAAWGDAINVAAQENVMLFAHRTTHGGPFRNIDQLPVGSIFTLTGSDGHNYNYQVVRTDIVAPSYNVINKIGLDTGPITAQLVACHPPGKVSYRIVVTGRLVSIT